MERSSTASRLANATDCVIAASSEEVAAPRPFAKLLASVRLQLIRDRVLACQFRQWAPVLGLLTARRIQLYIT
jgi:hypothetical protein